MRDSNPRPAAYKAGKRRVAAVARSASLFTGMHRSTGRPAGAVWSDFELECTPVNWSEVPVRQQTVTAMEPAWLSTKPA
jgi:hypothetical protein